MKQNISDLLSKFQYKTFNKQSINFPNYGTATFLIFDTETTGLPKKTPMGTFHHPYYFDMYDSARLIQLSWVMCELDLSSHIPRILYHEDYYIRNDEVINKAYWVNKIKDSTRSFDGLHINEILQIFLKDVNSVNFIVCHGCDFDLGIVASEMFRLKYDQNIINILLDKFHICTKLRRTAEEKRMPLARQVNINVSSKYQLYSAMEIEEIEDNDENDEELYVIGNRKPLETHNSLYDAYLTFELFKRKILHL
jgi:DNA polymerase III epsilon subunit-like protein